MLHFLKQKKYSIPLGAILIVVVIGIFRGGDDAPEYEFVVAKKGLLTQEVSVTGQVRPAESVDLAFEIGGKVASVLVKVGDSIPKGTVLVKLTGGEVLAQLAQSEAGLLAEEAKLRELTRGTRLEEVQVQQVKVSNAEVAQADAKAALINDIRDAYTKSDDAVRTKTDQFYINALTNNPQLNLQVNFQLKSDLETGRAAIERMLKNWREGVLTLSLENVFDAQSIVAKNNLIMLLAFLDNNTIALNGIIPSISLSQTTIDKYKTDVSTARTNINLMIQQVTASEEKVRSAESALLLAQNELTLLNAGSTEEEIHAQEARVKEAQATVDLYSAQLAKRILTAPISGTVIRQDARVGEIITANNSLVSIISNAEFEIEVFIPEVDIPKVKISNEASVTLDAYGDDVQFEAAVTDINPAETVIDGVSTYLVTLQFPEADERIRSGMTANIDIFTDKREDVISIPQRAVTDSGGKQTVRILEGKNIREQEVTVGLRGSDGAVEIISGLNEGDQVVIFEK